MCCSSSLCIYSRRSKPRRVVRERERSGARDILAFSICAEPLSTPPRILPLSRKYYTHNFHDNLFSNITQRLLEFSATTRLRSLRIQSADLYFSVSCFLSLWYCFFAYIWELWMMFFWWKFEALREQRRKKAHCRRWNVCCASRKKCDTQQQQRDTPKKIYHFPKGAGDGLLW